MERRNVIKHGPSTHIVSLPADWVRKNNIQKGDEICVSQNGRELVISTDTHPPPLSIKQDVSKLPPFLVTRLLARDYQKGYDDIILIHENPETLQAIKNKTQDLMGFEIIEQDEHSCHIQSVTHSLQIDFDNSLRKAFIIVKQMLETCAEAYKQGDEKALRNIQLKDMEVNRFTYFCLRQINKERHMDPGMRHQAFVLYHLVETLEDLGDMAVQIADKLSQAPKNSTIQQALDTLKKQYDASYEYFYSPEVHLVETAFENYKKVEELVEKIADKNPSKFEVMAAVHLQQATELIYPYTTMRLDLLKT